MGTKKHFLQSKDWAKFQESLGRETIQKSGNGWSYLAIVEQGKFNKRLYCPYGPIAQDLQSLKLALMSLEFECQMRKLDFIRIEPQIMSPGNVVDSRNYLAKLGLKKVKSVQPSNTAVTDVSVSDEDIIANLSTLPRRILRKCQKAGISYRTSSNPNDIAIFLDMIHDVSRRTKMQPHSDEYFIKMATTLFPSGSMGMIVASLPDDNTETTTDAQTKDVACVVYALYDDVMYYVHAASYSHYRKLSPATALAVECMLQAHRWGSGKFDWCGVAPEDAPDNHPWKGFTDFKMKMGAKRHTYLGTYERPAKSLLKKVKYWIYLLLSLCRQR